MKHHHHKAAETTHRHVDEKHSHGDARSVHPLQLEGNPQRVQKPYTSISLNPGEIDRSRYYISQLGDKNYRNGYFACAPSSLTMALADYGARDPRTGRLVVGQPPTEKDRYAIMVATGTLAEGHWTGGPQKMEAFAKHYGLNAEAYYSNDVNTLNQQLEKGRGIILGGHNPGSKSSGHFVYINGRDAQGYVVGDPGHTSVTHWTPEHLQAFMTGHGFVAVWNNNNPAIPRMVANAGGSGHTPSLIIDRQVSANPQTGQKTGNNGSLFRVANFASERVNWPANSPDYSASADYSPVPGTRTDTAYATTHGSALRVLGNSSDTSDNLSTAALGASIPRLFSSPKPDENVGDSEKDQLPDDLSWEETLILQNDIDAIVAHLINKDGNAKDDSKDIAFTYVDMHDPADSDYISLGLGNWHQEGDLSQLFVAWNQDSPIIFKDIFGADANHLLDADWVKGHNFNSDSALMAKINQALANPTMQNTQIQLTRELVGQAVKIGYQAGIRSQGGFAVVADVCNQVGAGAVINALKAQDVQAVLQQHNEVQALARMQTHLNHAPLSSTARNVALT